MTDQEAAYQPIDYSARRSERAAARKNSDRRRGWVLGASVVLAAVVVLSAAEAAITVGRVHPGVRVSGVAVGGMTPANARALLHAKLPAKTTKPVTVRYGKQKWKITAESVRLGFDYDAQVRRAMSVGRGDGLLGDLGARLRAWTTGVEVTASPRFDRARLASAMDRIAKGTDVAPKDAKVVIEGTTPKVIDGQDGRALDRTRTEALLRAAFVSEGERTLQAPVPVAPMRVTAEAAKPAAAMARTMLASPAVVVFEEKSWTFEPESIAKWVAFRSRDESGGSSPKLEAYISPEAAERPIMTTIGAKVGRPARDARFTTSNGRVTIVPSQDGIGPNIEALSKSLTAALSNPSAERRVQLRTQRTEPSITTDKARTMGIKERISTYTTTYPAGNRPRVTNIHLLGDSLDGALVEPGGVFSFNARAGERTAAKGYQEAPAIVNGKLVPQLGGGVCQVGTTVFNAVFESGLPVVQRRNHSFYISHYPKGRDATVSWGGPDLRFKNSTDHWILVSVSYTSSSITVSLYGTDPRYDVSAESGEWTDIKPYPTEEVEDATMPEGSRVIEDSGVKGRTITVKRVVSKDGKVVRTDTFVSKYKPKAEVVRIGTKKTKAKPDAEKDATKTP